MKHVLQLFGHRGILDQFAILHSGTTAKARLTHKYCTWKQNFLPITVIATFEILSVLPEKLAHPLPLTFVHNNLTHVIKWMEH